MSLTTTKYYLILFAFALPLTINLFQFFSSDNGTQLLPAYTFSDAALFHYSAWFKATFSSNSYVSDIIVLSPYEATLSYAIKVFGYSNTTPLILNAILSALTSVFIALVSRDAFGNTAAFTSTIIYTLCAPILFFSGMPHKTIFVLLFISIANFCVLKFFKTKAWLYLIVFSCVLAAASIDRIHVLTIPAVLLFILITLVIRSKSKKPYVMGIASIIFVFALLNILSTTLYSTEPTYHSSVGLNIYTGHTKPNNSSLKVQGVTNHMLGHRTDPKKVAETALGHPLAQSEVTAYWVSRTINYITTNPGEYLSGQLRKLHHLFSQVSVSVKSERLSVWRFERDVLQFAAFDFASIFALFFASILAQRKQKSSTPISTYLSLAGIIYLLSLMATIVTERYRVGVFVFMIPLASFFLSQVLENFRKHKTELAVAVGLFGTSHLLMLTAPGAYANKEFSSKAREHNSLQSSNVALPFYDSRIALDQTVNQENCSHFITQLEIVKHNRDIDRAKNACDEIIRLNHPET